jgi:TatD DNase family protein
VAIGEFGLDYYYENSSMEDQQKALRYQLELAASSNKPCVFHIRDSQKQGGSAFDDFWPIFDEFTGIKGVIHSFSAGEKELKECLKRGLYIGLNGIMTFSKDDKQLAAAKAVPLNRLLLETDAPFLTPAPKRGTINEPANVELVAEFLSRLRGESVAMLAEATTGNAHALFGI